MKITLPLLCFCLLLLSFQPLKAQTCLNNFTIFDTQEEIDNFRRDYPGCTVILNNLVIEGAEITNLDSLAGISRIEGVLSIKNTSVSNLRPLLSLRETEGLFVEGNTALLNLQGLDSLRRVNGALGIDNSPALQSLEGLNQLEEVSDYFQVINNSSLRDLRGLEGLERIGEECFVGLNNALLSLEGLDRLAFIGSLYVYDNPLLLNFRGLEQVRVIGGTLKVGDNDPAVGQNGKNNIVNFEGLNQLDSIGFWLDVLKYPSLKSFDGLENLRVVNSQVTISGLDSLHNLKGLRNLERVGSHFGIYLCPQLRSLEGLEKLQRIGGNLIFRWCNSLESMFALRNLRSINGKLFIQNADSLTSLRGLGNIDPSTITDLEINGNDKLALCSESSICNYVLAGVDVLIRNNAPGCNSPEQVLRFCADLSKVYYQFFYDQNGNKIWDGEDYAFSDAALSITPGAALNIPAGVNNGGTILLEEGQYTISYLPESNLLMELTTDSVAYHITIEEDTYTCDSLLFGLRVKEERSKVIAYLGSQRTRCFETIPFWVSARNLGSTEASGTLWLEIDERIDSLTFIDQPDTIGGPYLYGWHFDSLLIGGNTERRLRMRMPGPMPGMDTLKFQSYVDFEDVQGQFRSFPTLYYPLIRCSYDPNDKLVSPNRANTYTLFEEDLIYTIRFQNTGNDFAYDVVIRDTLDDNLDASTFKVLNSSHAEVLSTSLEADRYLTFSFRDIFLPDSTADLEGSQGYVSYIIRPKAGLPEQTLIHNTAGIYFDFNPPIQTNTTVNTLVSQLVVSTREPQPRAAIRIAPNPFKHRTQVRIESEQVGGKHLFLRDIYGRLLLQFEVGISNQLQIQGDQLLPGVYILELRDDQGALLATQRLLRQ